MKKEGLRKYLTAAIDVPALSKERLSSSSWITYLETLKKISIQSPWCVLEEVSLYHHCRVLSLRDPTMKTCPFLSRSGSWRNSGSKIHFRYGQPLLQAGSSQFNKKNQALLDSCHSFPAKNTRHTLD